MSSKQIYRSALMAATGVAALGLTACANSHASDRYGYSHHDYESTATCSGTCGVTTPKFRPAPKPAPIYTHYDYESSPSGCATKSPCGTTSHVSTGYGYGYGSTISTGTVHTGAIASPSYSTETAPCPAGTSSQPDGTCLQRGGSSHISSYTTGSTISSGSSYSGSSYSSGSFGSSIVAADCPAGTTAQPDGTCMQHGGSSYSFSSTTTTTPVTTYVPPVTTYTPPVVTNCHLSTGTTGCGISSTATDIYVAPSTSYSTGYQSSGVYSSSDYLPIRK